MSQRVPRAERRARQRTNARGIRRLLLEASPGDTVLVRGGVGARRLVVGVPFDLPPGVTFDLRDVSIELPLGQCTRAGEIVSTWLPPRGGGRS